MADIAIHSITGAYLGADIAIETSRTLEVWAVDAAPAMAMVACWLRLRDQQGSAAEILIAAGQTYSVPARWAGGWTYNLKLAAVGNGLGVVVLS